MSLRLLDLFKGSLKDLSFHWAQTSQQSLVNKFPPLCPDSQQKRTKIIIKMIYRRYNNNAHSIAFALIRFPALSRVHNRLPPFPNHYFQLIKISFQRHFPKHLISQSPKIPDLTIKSRVPIYSRANLATLTVKGKHSQRKSNKETETLVAFSLKKVNERKSPTRRLTRNSWRPKTPLWNSAFHHYPTVCHN